MRENARASDEIRHLKIEKSFLRYPEGSVLVEMGAKVICGVSVEEKVPPFLKNSGKGWLTAEYAMLPRSTQDRSPRETQGLGGRPQEIRRFIGRSLRRAVSLEALGERTLTLDCDVLQADGGTRCAAITGAFVAAADAVAGLREAGLLAGEPILDHVAAVSVGLYQGEPVLDLDYEEDSGCDADCNVVMTGSGGIVEVQGTAEGDPFSRAQLERLLDYAATGIARLVELQREALAAPLPGSTKTP